MRKACINGKWPNGQYICVQCGEETDILASSLVDISLEVQLGKQIKKCRCILNSEGIDSTGIQQRKSCSTTSTYVVEPGHKPLSLIFKKTANTHIAKRRCNLLEAGSSNFLYSRSNGNIHLEEISTDYAFQIENQEHYSPFNIKTTQPAHDIVHNYLTLGDNRKTHIPSTFELKKGLSIVTNSDQSPLSESKRVLGLTQNNICVEVKTHAGFSHNQWSKRNFSSGSMHIYFIKSRTELNLEFKKIVHTTSVGLMQVFPTNICRANSILLDKNLLGCRIMKTFSNNSARTNMHSLLNILTENNAINLRKSLELKCRDIIMSEISEINPTRSLGTENGSMHSSQRGQLKEYTSDIDVHAGQENVNDLQIDNDTVGLAFSNTLLVAPAIEGQSSCKEIPNSKINCTFLQDDIKVPLPSCKMVVEHNPLNAATLRLGCNDHSPFMGFGRHILEVPVNLPLNDISSPVSLTVAQSITESISLDVVDTRDRLVHGNTFLTGISKNDNVIIESDVSSQTVVSTDVTSPTSRMTRDSMIVQTKLVADVPFSPTRTISEDFLNSHKDFATNTLILPRSIVAEDCMNLHMELATDSLARSNMAENCMNLHTKLATDTLHSPINKMAENCMNLHTKLASDTLYSPISNMAEDCMNLHTKLATDTLHSPINNMAEDCMNLHTKLASDTLHSPINKMAEDCMNLHTKLATDTLHSPINKMAEDCMNLHTKLASDTLHSPINNMAEDCMNLHTKLASDTLHSPINNMAEDCMNLHTKLATDTLHLPSNNMAEDCMNLHTKLVTDTLHSPINNMAEDCMNLHTKLATDTLHSPINKMAEDCMNLHTKLATDTLHLPINNMAEDSITMHTELVSDTLHLPINNMAEDCITMHTELATEASSPTVDLTEGSRNLTSLNSMGGTVSSLTVNYKLQPDVAVYLPTKATPEGADFFLTMDKTEVCVNSLNQSDDELQDTSLEHEYLEHSPLLFSEEEEDVDDSATRTSLLDEIRMAEETRLCKLRELVQVGGVLPPPSVTMPQLTATDILELLTKNTLTRAAFEKPTPQSCQKMRLTCDSRLAQIKECVWPDVKQCCYPDIYYNNSTTSEEFELLCMKFRERYVGNETASSCNVWFTLGCNSGKKRKRVGGPSPGRRLSHLASRRRMFSKDNLFSISTASRELVAGERRQINLDARKLGLLQQSKSLLEKMSIGDHQIPSGSNTGTKIAHKRALFQSPDESKKYKKSANVSGNSKKSDTIKKLSFKRALFSVSTEVSEAPAPIKNVVHIAKHDGVSKKRPLLTAKSHEGVLEGLSISSSKRKLVFSDDRPLVAATLCSTGKAEFKGKKVVANQTNDYYASFLDCSQRKKLMWAFSQALRSVGIGAMHVSFRPSVQALGRACKIPILEAVRNLNGHISEVMLEVAMQHVAQVVKQKPSEVGVSSSS